MMTYDDICAFVSKNGAPFTYYFKQRNMGPSTHHQPWDFWPYLPKPMSGKTRYYILDGWKTPFVAPNGSPLFIDFIGNIFWDYEYPELRIAPSVHHWIA